MCLGLGPTVASGDWGLRSMLVKDLFFWGWLRVEGFRFRDPFRWPAFRPLCTTAPGQLKCATPVDRRSEEGL